ncbi:MAG: hypothetical protein NTX24_03975 [Candidatus Pacearchaeota archaeon]|nr:hypothetical protein [Candidatus Pacearchaeota archaeon]
MKLKLFENKNQQIFNLQKVFTFSKNKKAFYFTLIVMFCIILLLLLSFQYRKDMTSEGEKARIITANNFVKSIERDASRAVYISGYRTMLAISAYLTTTHNNTKPEPIDGQDGRPTVQMVFADALFNSSLNYSLNYPEAEDFLRGATISNWTGEVNALAVAVNLNTTFDAIDPGEFVVNQTDPWYISLSFPVRYNLTDTISGVSWHRDIKITALIPIVNFEDPLYVLEFGPNCGNRISSNVYTPILRGGFSDPCNLTNITAFFATGGTAGSMYIPSLRAPSYLMRLAGNYTADPYGQGIESLIDTSKLSNCIDNPNLEYSVVDFEFVNEIFGEGNVIGMTKVRLYEDEAENASLYDMNWTCFA